jgi:hypothetical protein
MNVEADKLREMLGCYQRFVNKIDDLLEYRQTVVTVTQYHDMQKELSDGLRAVMVKYHPQLKEEPNVKASETVHSGVGQSAVTAS